MALLIATHNEGKQREFSALLRQLRCELVLPGDLGFHIRVPEDRPSYCGNALQKASAYCAASGLIALADDSGLEVDALNGAPGIRSARYAAGSDEDRVAALLDALESVPPDARTARFRCAVAVVTPWGETHCFEGLCEGRIATSPSGSGGFGYDPLFYMPELGATMAQLSPEVKNQVSHRARAVASALPWLRDQLPGMDMPSHAP
jgi:XTP/dITP diphosphohydrolase